MHKRTLLTMLAVPIAALTATAVLSQDKGSVDPKPLLPLVNPNDPELGAKELFGRKTSPAPLATHSIGFYDKGCLAGAEALPINGKTWQVMRLSRNRNWAHPDMVALLERLSVKAHEVAGWPGLLVGDMSQPRGGPMLTGHASHQIGLDADIWLTPMPKRQLSRNEREEMSATWGAGRMRTGRRSSTCSEFLPSSRRIYERNAKPKASPKRRLLVSIRGVHRQSMPARYGS
jgi:penicillin-insensitive murein endopeptidase